MNILVCVKHIPDHIARINPQKNGIEMSDSVKYRMNRFDEYAVEEAVAIKERNPETTIDVVTIGPERAESVVSRAMGMGADNGFMAISDEYKSPSEISHIIAEIARKSQYDLIFTGIMSEDQMNAQTGQMLAAHLDLASVSGVVSISFINGTGNIRVEREREGGVRESLIVRMPAVLTIQAGINHPRYPALSAILRANSKKLEIFNHAQGLSEKDQTVVYVKPSEKLRHGKILQGSTSEKAKQLIEILRERNALI